MGVPRDGAGIGWLYDEECPRFRDIAIWWVLHNLVLYVGGIRCIIQRRVLVRMKNGPEKAYRDGGGPGSRRRNSDVKGK